MVRKIKLRSGKFFLPETFSASLEMLISFKATSVCSQPTIDRTATIAGCRCSWRHGTISANGPEAAPASPGVSIRSPDYRAESA